MATALITTKGQVTIPKKVRDHLKLNPGDRVDFVMHNDGTVSVTPATVDVRELEGILHRPGMKTVSIGDMKKAVRKRLSSVRPQ